MLATGITFAVIFGITAIACFGTAGAFTSGGMMVGDDLALGAAAAETADTFLSAIGDLALGAIAVTGWCSAAVTAVFGWLTAAGASRMKAAKTLELYADTAEGFDWHQGLSLSMLADLTHKKKTKALKMLRKFIHKGWLSAWLDEKNDKLYLTAEDYRAAQENQPQPEPEKAPTEAAENPFERMVVDTVRQGLASGDDISVSAIASRLNLGEQTFRRRFVAETGKQPKTFVMAIQMEMAAHMLTSDASLPVAEVARACGFDDASAFSHAFKKAYSCSPTQFRQKRA